MKNDSSKIRIAALGDIHIKESAENNYQTLFPEVASKADILLLCGDITGLGLMTKTKLLITALTACKIPVVVVLGNHEYENNNQEEISTYLQSHGLRVLNGTEYILEKDGKKYGFTGVKGFGGGFRLSMWGRFGEPEQKSFLRCCIDRGPTTRKWP